jgi:SAM-dependent methyltransferase
MNFHRHIRAQLARLLAQPGTDEVVLNNALRLLAKYRSTLLQNTLVQTHGTQVLAGPFAGMAFVERSAEGCHVPKLLGCYEEELHDFLYALPEAGYATVLNIGCAEGYYAVGIKRLAPDIRMYAYDINPKAQAACRTLAARNGVDVTIEAEFRPENFAAFVSRENERVLVWCDIEGAELDLLDPLKAPALGAMDLVVELHPTARGHAADLLPRRFEDTHAIEIREARGHDPVLPPFLRQLGHLDQLLAAWEWRSAPTPWAILRAKPGRASAPAA